MQKFRDALELAETAVRLDARLPQARSELGSALLFKRYHDAAIAEFERALALNSQFRRLSIRSSLDLCGRARKSDRGTRGKHAA